MEPPAFEVKNPGTKLFKISTATVTIAQIIRVVVVIEHLLTKYEASIPPQQIGVPGMPGIMQPIVPIKNKTIVKAISKISAFVMLENIK